MGRYLVYCVFVIVPFYTYSYGFLSGGKKDSGVKLCVLVRLLSAMSFSHFGGQRSRSPGTINAQHDARIDALWSWVGGAFGIGAVVAWCKAEWWDLRPASLLTHLFKLFLAYLSTILKSL